MFFNCLSLKIFVVVAVFFFKLFLLSCCMPTCICNIYFKLHQVKTIIYFICKVKRKSDVSGNKTDNITFMRVDRDI